jgi:8-oxo-dGTP diphosphatase
MQEVSAAIFIKNAKVLLAQRGKKGNLPDYWEFPGGKREKNETIFECLEREIMEELNIKCEAIKIFSENIYEYETGAIKLIAIISKLKDGKIKLNVHTDCRWVEINKILDYNLAPADIYIAKLLLKEVYYA